MISGKGEWDTKKSLFTTYYREFEILNDPPSVVEWSVWFPTVPFKPLTDQGCQIYLSTETKLVYSPVLQHLKSNFKDKHTEFSFLND